MSRIEREGDMSWDWLCDSSVFLTRSHCGAGWTPRLEAAYKVSNAIIALAYFAIPAALFLSCKKKRTELPAPRMSVMVLMFIILCGLTHVCDVIVFYWAPYRLFAFISVLTALVSGAAACDLPVVIGGLVRLPSREY